MSSSLKKRKLIWMDKVCRKCGKIYEDVNLRDWNYCEICGGKLISKSVKEMIERKQKEFHDLGEGDLL